MGRLRNLLVLFCTLVLLVCSGCGQAEKQKTKDYERIVIASDVHYVTKSKNREERQERQKAKDEALQTLNTWKDVDLVVFLGDLIEKRGSVSDYEQAKAFYDRCQLPKTIVAGNHELIYQDEEKGNKLKRATPEQRAEHQKRFLTYFNQKSLYYTRTLGQYFLIFVAPDMLKSKYSVEFSDDELTWLGQQLEWHKDKPTLIFCHAPLDNTLRNYNKQANSPNFIAQPADKLQAILTRYPQIKLWVSGHTHTRLNESSFADSEINIYQGKILNIHNSSWEHGDICVNSLYLYNDRIEIKTYNLTKHKNLPKFNREVMLSGKSEK